MSRHIPDSIRKFVAIRAGHRCEYCRLPADVAGFSFEIDHVIALKHGGLSRSENLALACPICNGNKGSDLGNLLADKPEIVRFFNPRTDHWHDHFKVENGRIFPKTIVGEATLKIFDFNRPEDVFSRKRLAELGLFPG